VHHANFTGTRESVVHHVRVQCFGVVEFSDRRVLHEGPRGVRRGTAFGTVPSDGEGGQRATSRPLGAAHPRLFALPQGRLALALQRSDPQVRIADFDEARFTTDRGSERLQDDKGCFPQRGVHGETHYGVHRTFGRLR
jgi:hypothetical protein